MRRTTPSEAGPLRLRNQITRQSHLHRAGRSCLWSVLAVLATMVANSRIQAGELSPSGVVINEVMYHVPKDRDDLQYLELFNAGTNGVDLSGWSLKAGVKFHFPAGTAMAPGAYLLVCGDAAAFKARYGAQPPVAGAFKGRLSHRGEKVALVDAGGRVVDTVTYADRAPWPAGSDGCGASLERICPFAAGTDPENWAASEPRPNRLAEGTPGGPNSCYSPLPWPGISEVQCDRSGAGKPLTVTARVKDAAGVQTVSLSWLAFSGPGSGTWNEVPMPRQSGDATNGLYTGTLPAPASDRLIRYKIRAKNEPGTERVYPAKSGPRSSLTFSTFVNTNTARVPFVYLLTPKPMQGLGQASQFRGRRPGLGQPVDSRAAWDAAMIYLPPGGQEARVFDQVRVRPRRGGFKVHFYADQLFNEMSAIALINKGPPRWVLTESLSQDLYRRAGAQAPDTEIVRLALNRRAAGYYVEVEVPNKSFLRRHGRDADGNLYKLLWAGRNLTQQHKKMTNPRGGHQDLIELVGGLNRSSGAAQWAFIQRNFNVEQMINCYAVGLCIQDWDGFFNNYYAYHDLRPGGKWEVYPWDKDKTWGDYDGASSAYDWYSMPLSFGSGNRSAGSAIFGGFGGGGPFGGGSQWSRPPGIFSGPLLANPEFRQRFLARLREICQTIFTPETMGPVIRGLANRVEPEVAFRATATGQNPAFALQEFRNDIQSFLNQVVHRREFILQHLPAEKP